MLTIKIKRHFNKIIFLLILFSVLFGIRYSFIKINSLIIVGCIGVVFYICQNYKKYKNVRFNISSLYPLFYLFIIIIISSILSNNLDIHLVQELIFINVIRFFAAYIIIYYYLIIYKKNASFENLIIVLSYLVLIQQIIAIITFFNPQIYVLLNTIFPGSELSSETAIGAFGYRLMGLGGYRFFGAGIINGFLIISLCYIFSKHGYSKTRLMLLLFLTIVGIIMARTTLMGIFIGILLLLTYKNGRKFTFTASLFLIALIFVFNSLSLSSSKYSDQIETLENFGFEMFINLADNKSINTKSTTKMMTMYIWPDNARTWLIGDTILRDGEGYYKGTDIGFIRLIFGIGLFGLFVYGYYHLKLLHVIKTKSNDIDNKYVIAIFIYFVVLNFKGLTDLSLYLFLIYQLLILKNKSLGKHKNKNLKYIIHSLDGEHEYSKISNAKVTYL